ncbi:MAG TPA: hypothetical protein VNZ53_20235 [Steroidobacteraceae bacterium]|jgi:hypothetical protein|nr:hypothetical protein [Steroidobacteraceae bacterium]
MRVLSVIALLVGAVFMILFVLANLARDLSRLSYHSPPDLDDSDDWDVTLDEFYDWVPGVVPYREQWPVSQYRNARTQG